MKSLLNLSGLPVDEIMEILDNAEKYKSGENRFRAGGALVANLFFEPSTRTQYSFEAAELRLGCTMLNFNPEGSSMKKGETFYDTVRTFEQLGVSALVIRHSENEFYRQLENVKPPILNAGDGTGNHPTQSLLDLMTIRQEYGRFEGLKIAIVGDVRYSRVAHTNFEVFRRLGMDTYEVAPEEYAEKELAAPTTLDEAVEKMDIIMLLRVQRERHGASTDEMSADEYNSRFGMNAARVARMKPGAIIMHPAPFNRGVEISDDVVECEKSRIFKQMENGVYVRMAVLKRALGD